MATFSSTGHHETSEPHQENDGAHALKEVLAGIERDLILAALQQSHGNKAKAARALGITERLMGLRVKRLGIDWRGLRRRGRASDAR
jgi:Nif-specific regulatory protein